MRLLLKNIFLLLFIIIIANGLNAQTTIIKGQVTDALTDEPLISATINFKGTSIGMNTDFDGKFLLESDQATDSIVVSYLGYETAVRAIKIGKKQNLKIQLESINVNLQQVTIVGKTKYKNRNPAVTLIKKAIAQKDKNRAKQFDYYEYEKYEKVTLGLSNLSEKFKNRKIFRKFQFLFENLDTSSIEGKEVLPIYLKEALSEVRFRKSPEKLKEIIRADTMVMIEGYIDSDGFNQYVDNLYQNVDIYDNNIVMLEQQFLSPIANNAPTFYKFFIQDTVQIDGTECIELFFAPKNKLDILFQGKIYIAYKDNHAVKKVDMSTNPKINLNWIKNLHLVQEFQKVDGKGYMQVTDEFSAEFSIFKKGLGFFGRRSVSNKNIVVNQARPNEDYKGLALERKIIKPVLPEIFWENNRHTELTKAEATTYKKIDSLKNSKAFKNVLNVISLLVSGYTKIGPNFEIGPVNTFYSFSPLEGLRLRLGGRTTLNFSENLEIENYIAYGFKDKRFKGYLGFSYALGKGNLNQFPVRRLRVSAQREVKIPGQELQFVQEDNILLSFKRGTNDKYLYNTNFAVEFRNEFRNHFTFEVGYRNWLQAPALNLEYIKQNNNGELEQVEEIRTSELNVLLRWAPNEKFYQGKTYRKPIINKYPIFAFRYHQGIKGLLGGAYNYSNISLKIYKRFFLSQLGYSDIVVKGGMIFGEVPYPLLTVHAGNQTYSYQMQGYNLMNFLEFTSERYASINIDHNFNGFILNKIPLIRQLRLRETANIRVLYGSISDKNMPGNGGAFFFPTNAAGEQTTFSLDGKPYIEGSVGLANVFKFFRVDLVKRFTYLENPGVTGWGIRARFKVYM